MKDFEQFAVACSAAFFHVSTLEPATREVLLAGLKEEDLPNNMLCARGRNPYAGPRKILGAMSEPFGPPTATFR